MSILRLETGFANLPGVRLCIWTFVAGKVLAIGRSELVHVEVVKIIAFFCRELSSGGVVWKDAVVPTPNITPQKF